MNDKKPTKKQKIVKFLGISSVIISLVLSSMAFYYAGDNQENNSLTPIMSCSKWLSPALAECTL